MASPAAAMRKRTRAPAPNPLPSPQGNSASISEISCEECGFGHADEVLLLCDRCDRGFHTFCLRPILPSVPNGAWYCPSCSKPKKPRGMNISLVSLSVIVRIFQYIFVEIPLVHTKIVDFSLISLSKIARFSRIYLSQ